MPDEREYTLDDARFDLDALSMRMSELEHLVALLSKAVSDYQIPVHSDLRDHIVKQLRAVRF